MCWNSLTLAVCAFPFAHFIHTNTIERIRTHERTCSFQPSLASSALLLPQPGANLSAVQPGELHLSFRSSGLSHFHPYTHPAIYRFIYLYIHLSIHLFTQFHPLIYPFIISSICIHLSIHLSIFAYTHSFIHPSIDLYTHPPIHLYMHTYIQPFI